MRKSKGFTLMELIVAIVLLSTVLFTATSLLLTFQRQHVGFMETESSLMETVLAANEEMVSRIIEANLITIPAPTTTDSIQVRVDDSANPSPADFTNDTLHEYRFDSGTHELKYRKKVGSNAFSAEQVLAHDIQSLSFTRDQALGFSPNNVNTVKITLTAQPTPPDGPMETVQTSVTARCRSAV